MSDLVGNSEDQFSWVAVQIVPISFIDCKSTNSQIQKLAYNSEIEKSQNESHLCLFVCYVYLFALILRPTLKNSLFAVTRPTHQNCPYPKYFIDILKEDFFFI